MNIFFIIFKGFVVVIVSIIVIVSDVIDIIVPSLRHRCGHQYNSRGRHNLYYLITVKPDVLLTATLQTSAATLLI